MMKLYFAPNTRAERVAWLLNELGLEYEIERYTLGDKAMRTPEFLAISPNGRVPVLDDGDVRISESTAIAQYLLCRYGEGRFAPMLDSPDFPGYLQWLHYGEGMLMGPLGNYVVEAILLPPDRRSEVHAKRALRLLGNLLISIDSHLEGRDYLAGDFTIADVVTGHACMMSAQVGVDISDMQNLSAYVRRLKERPALKKVLALREAA
ncbi:MAG: glutathione S-transferase family protein [Rhodospirillaceae bacterium]|nr:glutathione S-transferase family protein [Rhodospirillaceae bacterium]MCY4311830.1 glutathione S-transferase family protein [Rhodospirillaceae bacterium]